MFLKFDKEKCPLCGTTGKEGNIENISECPRCGTQFNEFGIVMAKKKEMDLHWN